MTSPKYGVPNHTFLMTQLDQYDDTILTMVEAPLPTDLQSLIDMYEVLGKTTSIAESCLVAAFDALDPSIGQGCTDQPEEYQKIKQLSFQLLSATGRQFARLDVPFAELVHGGGGWSNQPVSVDTETLYRNTFKTNQELTSSQRLTEYEQRVQQFLRLGGSFESIVLLDEQNIHRLRSWSHYDYVMLPNLETRVYPTSPRDRGGKPKAGHSLLVGSERDFDDRLVLSAGEMWVLKDHAGDLEAVVIASNSGHFKPDFQSLQPASKGIVTLGIPADRIVQFGGPNNIAAIFREIAELHPVGDLSHRLPPDPVQLMADWNTIDAQ